MILLVSHGAALGGSPISCLNIARTLKQDFTFRFLFGEEGPMVERARAEGFEATVLPRPRGWLLWIPMIFRLENLIKDVDLVHLNTLTSYYKYPAWAARWAGRPVVWFVRENPEEKRCLRLRFHMRHLAARVVTVSHDTARHLDLPPERIRTIWNGVDLAQFRPEPNPTLRSLPGNAGRVILGVVASIEARKGILETIEACARLDPARYRLYIVGRDRSPSGDYGKQVEARIAALGLGENVILLGERSDMPVVMNAIDLFILFSGWEGMARTILEAMACGVPVVASRRGGNPEQVEPGVNGALAAYPDPASLAGAIQPYLDNPALLSLHGAASRRLAEERFDLAVNARNLHTLYGEMLS